MKCTNISGISERNQFLQLSSIMDFAGVNYNSLVCKVFLIKGVKMADEKETEKKDENNELGYKEQFDEIKNEFEKKLKEQQDKFTKELKDRDDVIKELLSNQKTEKDKEQKELSDFDRMVKNTIELVKKRS